MVAASAGMVTSWAVTAAVTAAVTFAAIRGERDRIVASTWAGPAARSAVRVG
jgi:hypothetical protein